MEAGVLLGKKQDFGLKQNSMLLVECLPGAKSRPSVTARSALIVTRRTVHYGPYGFHIPLSFYQ